MAIVTALVHGSYLSEREYRRTVPSRISSLRTLFPIPNCLEWNFGFEFPFCFAWLIFCFVLLFRWAKSPP